MPHSGHCLCNAVGYGLDHDIVAISNCHCHFCRRAHGAAFVTIAFVPTDKLTITRGDESIARYEGRFFCRECGTRLFNRTDAFPDGTALMVASLDPEPDLRPAFHCNLESKAPWYEVLDDRPKFDGFPPGVAEAMKKAKSGNT